MVTRLTVKPVEGAERKAHSAVHVQLICGGILKAGPGGALLHYVQSDTADTAHSEWRRQGWEVLETVEVALDGRGLDGLLDDLLDDVEEGTG